MDLNFQIWISAGVVFAAVVLATIAVVLGWEAFRQRSRQRVVLKKLEELTATDLGPQSGPGSLFRRDDARVPKWLEPIASRVPHIKDLEILIEQSAAQWTPQTYLIFSGGFGVALGFGLFIALRGVPALVAGAAVGASMPYLYLRRKRGQRMAAFEEGLPEAIDLLGRALRAGHPLSSGLKMVADETADPIGTEFRRVFEEQRFGLGMDESLLGMADRIPLIDVRIFVAGVLIQREVGGNLSEILEKLSMVIRQRFSILRQLRTYTAQGRMSGYILGGLPIFLGLLLFVINREDMVAFVTHPLGRLFMLIAIVLQALGYLWISRIVKIEV